MSGTRRRIPIGYLIDTWTWIEYWLENPVTLPYIEGQEPICTSIISLTEITRYCLREYDENMMTTRITDIRTRSKILTIDEAIAVQAGTYIRQEFNGIADALILATARHHDLKLVTGDEHFRHLSDCIVL